MKRLEILAEQIKQVPPYVDSCFDYMNMGSLLTKEENVSNCLCRKLEKK